jgi:hypothetical protein
MAKSSRRPVNKARLLRDLHLYLGVFFAPLILFFATTGAIQVLGLHEASRDGRYTPPPVVEKLSEVHIHQRYAAKPKRPEPAGAAARPRPAARPAAPAPPAPGRQLVKWLFVACAAGLGASALLGLWMGFTQGLRRRTALVLALAGAALPVLLLAL